MIKTYKDIAVIGAGVAGVLAAYYLVKDGHKVTIYDSEHYPGMKCSYANGGQISVSNSETWHSWSNVVKGAKWLFKKDAPLLIRPGLDLDRAKWLARFLINTAKGVREKNTATTIAMGITSRELYKEIAVDEGLKFDFKQSGILHFYKDSKYFESAKALQPLYESNGCEWHILNSNEVVDKDTSLAETPGILGGIWTQSDWVGDIHKFCTELVDVLKKKYGVTFRSNHYVDVASLEILSQIYDSVVISAGAESAKLAKILGDYCTIYPVKGYSITIEGADTAKMPTVSLLDDQAKIVSSTLGTRLRVAGTAELCGYNYDITRSRITPLLDWVHNNFPNLNINNYRSWACLRPMTSDMMPMVSRSKRAGVYYHTGHGHLGWTVSPATAKQLVEMVSFDR